MAVVVAPTEQERRRSVVAGTLGNLVEWFDWSVYGFFAPFFAASFFPQEDERTRLLSAFAVFAVGFFFRPLGGRSWARTPTGRDAGPV